MRLNRTYGGVGGCRGAIPGIRPDQDADGRRGVRRPVVALDQDGEQGGEKRWRATAGPKWAGSEGAPNPRVREERLLGGSGGMRF